MSIPQSVQHDLAVIGMAVMGRNLAMNAAEKGLSVAVYNRSSQRTDEAVTEATKQGLVIYPYTSLTELVGNLKKPRKIFLLLKAGAPVDDMLAKLLELVEAEDIIVDSGNEFFRNTEARTAIAAKKGVNWVGMGVSGGEEGARHGPSICPGGSQKIYDHLAPILTKMAAQVDGKPCVAFMGNGSAGNYVKTVHNGIEYGDMQLIAESYDLLKTLYHLKNSEISDIFRKWSRGDDLASYLIEITATILKTPLDGVPGAMLDIVKDVAASKGTGKWTIQEAAEKGVPCPTMQAALDSRYLSGFEQIRSRACEFFGEIQVGGNDKDLPTIDDIEKAMYCSKICSYAQGLMLISIASKVEGFDIHLDRVASIWVGGCIIRAKFLKEIQEAYVRNPNLENLILDDYFGEKLKAYSPSWRKVVSSATLHGIPIPAFSASLNYFDMLRKQRLPSALVQAQRDCFGSHTFLRADLQSDKAFHVNWESGEFLPIA